MLLRSPVSVHKILVVMIVPRRQEDWLRAGHDRLALRHCCYWTNLANHPVTGRRRTTVRIPTARVFDEAGIPVLLVGDSAANVVYGYDTTVPVSVDELLPLVRGVVRGTERALVVADLPFGSYQTGVPEALSAATRFLKETGAHAIKLEGGRRIIPQVEAMVAAGIPVMGHLGLTPQSVNVFGGYRVQGRGQAQADTSSRSTPVTSVARCMTLARWSTKGSSGTSTVSQCGASASATERTAYSCSSRSLLERASDPACSASRSRSPLRRMVPASTRLVATPRSSRT